MRLERDDKCDRKHLPEGKYGLVLFALPKGYIFCLFYKTNLIEVDKVSVKMKNIVM